MTETYDEFEDEFARPRSGKFPKVEEMEGKLLLIKPEKIETVRNRFAKTPEDKQTVERATADVVVFEDDGSYEEHLSMYLSQQVLLSACEEALKPGRKPMVLGRLEKVATKDTQEKLKIEGDAASFREAREKWLKGGGKGTEPRHVWVLSDFTDADAGHARAYLKKKDPFAANAASA
jgi:hypothetical protein